MGEHHYQCCSMCPRLQEYSQYKITCMKEIRVLTLLKGHLNLARDKMKFFADKRRSNRPFEVEDYGLLKLQPYKQSSMRSSLPQKLAAKFHGPYQVFERIGQVAYKLNLPGKTKIHNVFHISQLKKYHGQVLSSSDEVPTYLENQAQKPEKEMARRIIKKNNKAVSQILVQWQREDASKATWEDYHSFVKKYLDFHLRTKWCFKGEDLAWT